MQSLFLENIIRNICKFIYKISTPSQYKHNRRFWPYYSAERGPQGQLQKIYFKKQLVADNTNIVSTKNKTCMLIATGPSIHQVNPNIFEHPEIDYIGVNGAIALNNISFSSYIIIDHNFVTNRFDLVKKVLSIKCTFFTTARCLDLILRQIKLENIQCQIKVIETISNEVIEVFLNAEKPVDKNQSHYYIHQNFGFSKDIFNGTFDYFTVAYVSLQIINSLKYKTIYIAGLDMNNFNIPRFYETTEDKQATLLDIHTEIVLNAFDTAALYFKENDIKVFNLSKNSAVEAFEKIDSNSI